MATMRRHIPSTRALLIFDAVARHHGVGKAAEELCLTHSAVSQQLRLLETQIGVRLVQRTARGTELTEAGRRYHGQVRATCCACRTTRSKPWRSAPTACACWWARCRCWPRAG
jgi:DNA-binding transcriptional LysR family regulator